MKKLDTNSKKYGLILNTKETQIVIIDRNPSNIRKIVDFEVVNMLTTSDTSLQTMKAVT